MSTDSGTFTGIHYVIFDRKNGKILGTHFHLDAEKNQYVEPPAEELKKTLAQDKSITSRLTDQDATNLDLMLVTESANVGSTTRMKVDVKSRKLIAMPRLKLTADKSEISGDGSESANIELQAVDANDRPARDVEGVVRVTTDRGRLSERGGITKLVRGHAKIKLTASNETAHKVRVRAEMPDGSAVRGEVVLEFL